MNTPDDSIHFYEPTQGHGLPHDPFNAIVGPRPIGWIGSRSAEGIANLAPYSFFNAFNYVPPIVGFASIGRKDSLRNIEATGEFTWNLATRPLAEAMNASAAMVPAEVDEFDLAGLQMAPDRCTTGRCQSSQFRMPAQPAAAAANRCRSRHPDLVGAGRSGRRAPGQIGAARGHL
ncbi:flavin reductase family protein [Xanthomonas phaseoli pv. manihotis]|nr:flavin reductase family protein [Xanthomonas phaseoli pv. manihotis]MBO9764403.1 flavin reductase family protein [Xanthomonas phaseoli pv. manihotis]